MKTYEEDTKDAREGVGMKQKEQVITNFSMNI